MKHRTKARRRLAAWRPTTTSTKRWVMVHVGMTHPDELLRGMEIATTFEDRHGGKPPMYFARYTEDNTIRITVLTNQDNKSLKHHLKKLGIHTVRITERGGGSWEHCHVFQVAKHLFGKPDSKVESVVTGMNNMLNYTAAQEAAQHSEALWVLLSKFRKT